MIHGYMATYMKKGVAKPSSHTRCKEPTTCYTSEYWWHTPWEHQLEEEEEREGGGKGGRGGGEGGEEREWREEERERKVRRRGRGG